MNALHRSWVADQATRITLEVDRVASVHCAPEHHPRRLPSVSRATEREQAIRRAQWLECQRRPRLALRSAHLYLLAALIALATVLVYASGPSDPHAQADSAAHLADSLAMAQAQARFDRAESAMAAARPDLSLNPPESP